jgi:excisionase family DNA binding protein
MSKRAAMAASQMEQAQLPDWKLAYRMDEAAAATGYGESTLWRKISEGKLVARKDGGVTLIEREELLRYVRSLPTVRPRTKA